MTYGSCPDKSFPMDKYQSWVRTGLLKSGKSAKGLALALGIAPARVTEITKGDRKVKATEVAKIAAYLELPPPSDHIQYTTYVMERVRIMGRIEAGVWRERAEDTIEGLQSIPCVIDERYPPETQRAYLVGTKSVDAGVDVGDYVIVAPLTGDERNRRMLVVKMEKNGLEALALAGVIPNGGADTLQFLIPADQKPIHLSKAKVVGRVIAIYRPLI